MTTYGVREFKARVSAILRDLDEGDEVIITRRGKPCGRLTGVLPVSDDKPSLESLRGAMTNLPDATYQDFLEIKSIWRPGAPEPDES